MGKIHQEVRDNHLAQHPDEEEWLAPFLHGFDVTWARRRTAYNTTLSVYFLRPEPHLGDTFGFTQELLLAFADYPTVQPRAIQAAESFLHDDPARGRVERITYFVIAPMPNIRDWVHTYSASRQESKVILAFNTDELRESGGDSWFVRNGIAQQLFTRDLFDYRLPLEHDTYFFGREDLLLNYLDATRRLENRGLFGLRKTGKTSFLFKLQRYLAADGNADSLFYDCKSVSIRQLRWHELMERLCRDIAKLDKRRFKPPKDTRRYADVLENVLEGRSEQRPLVMVFDEIEYVSPVAKDDPHWTEDFLPFWQTIWAVQSKRRSLCVVLAGVNPTVVELDRVNGIQNPLFGIVSFNYLRGLAEAELRRMLRVLGRRMGLRFQDDAVEYLHERYGGHPLLTRMACSVTHQRLETARETRPVDVTRKLLDEEEAERDSELVFYCRHVVSELREFYEEEYELLELLAAGHLRDFVELSVQPEYSAHLKAYGLVDFPEGSVPRISIPVVGRYVAIEMARREGRKTILSVVEEGRRESWCRTRLESVLSEMRRLEGLVAAQGLPKLFGPNSFPEAERLAAREPCGSQDDFVAFINQCNRTLVESIDGYGKSIGKPKYFWEEIKSSYGGLWESLSRIRVYRNHAMHLHLTPLADASLGRFLEMDLEGRSPGHVNELWFVLQQCVLDGLLNGIEMELHVLGR